MTNHRSRSGSPTAKDGGKASLLIPLDAHEAMLALARFRYSAERAHGAHPGAETAHDSSSDG